MLLCCSQFKVPDILFATIEPPVELPTVGKGSFLQARICRQKREGRGEANARDISDVSHYLDFCTLYMYVCMNVCMCVCIYICIYAYVYVFLCVCMSVCVYTFLFMYACVYVFIYLCMICVFECMYVWCALCSTFSHLSELANVLALEVLKFIKNKRINTRCSDEWRNHHLVSLTDM